MGPFDERTSSTARSLLGRERQTRGWRPGSGPLHAFCTQAPTRASRRSEVSRSTVWPGPATMSWPGASARGRSRLDDAAQAVTFHSRRRLKRMLGRSGEREQRQLEALARVRSEAAGRSDPAPRPDR